MKTFLNEEIKPDTLGVLYLCKYTYNPPSIKVIVAAQFASAFDALQSYANIPNPESQLATGKTRADLFKELETLHNNLNSPDWVAELANCL